MRLTPHGALAHKRMIAIVLWRAEEFAQQSVTYVGFWALLWEIFCLLTEAVLCQISERPNLCLLRNNLFVLHAPFWLSLQVRERARDFFKFLCQLAVELEQKEHGKPGAPGRSSGTSGEQFVFPWTNHCSEAEPSSQGSGSCTVLDANILVVSHGAYMRNWIGYLVSDLNCTLPANLTKSQLSSVSPNTGVSHFIIKLENGNLLKPNITCVCLNQDSHLVDVGAECVASKVF